MNSAQRHYTVKSYFGESQYWIMRADGNLATYKPFATKEEAEAYALTMDPANFR